MTRNQLFLCNESIKTDRSLWSFIWQYIYINQEIWWNYGKNSWKEKLKRKKIKGKYSAETGFRNTVPNDHCDPWSVQRVCVYKSTEISSVFHSYFFQSENSIIHDLSRERQRKRERERRSSSSLWFNNSYRIRNRMRIHDHLNFNLNKEIYVSLKSIYFCFELITTTTKF